MSIRLTDTLIPKKFTRRVRIGFGLQAADPDVIRSLRSVHSIAEITLVGPRSLKPIRGFTVIATANPERRLAELLVHDEVAGIVRGTIDDFKTYGTYKQLTGIKASLQPTLLETPDGKQFFISTASNPEGWTRSEKLSDARDVANFLRNFGVRERIAVMAAVRHETFTHKKKITTGIQPVLNKTYTDANWVAGRLRRYGYRAENYSIDLDSAVRNGFNIIVPVNGLVANQVIRGMMLSGTKLISIPRLRTRHPYEDNTRSEKDFAWHVRSLVARILRHEQ